MTIIAVVFLPNSLPLDYLLRKGVRICQHPHLTMGVDRQNQEENQRTQRSDPKDSFGGFPI
jgi:hypothetical protein